MNYTSGNQISFTIQATVTRLFVRHGMVTANWGAGRAVSNVTIKGEVAEYIVGYESDTLVLWLNGSFDSSSTILISS